MNMLKETLDLMVDRWPDEEKLSGLNEEFKKSKTMPERWVVIKKAYEINLNHILKEQGRADPYFLDWDIVQSPIEKVAWEVLRNTQFTFFPQVPLLNYFVDFADPIRRVVVELDGKDWHDAEKDSIRDQNLMQAGWAVTRIKGFQVYGENEEPDYQDFDYDEQHEAALSEWKTETLEGIVSALEDRYFGDSA